MNCEKHNVVAIMKKIVYICKKIKAQNYVYLYFKNRR